MVEYEALIKEKALEIDPSETSNRPYYYRMGISPKCNEKVGEWIKTVTKESKR